MHTSSESSRGIREETTQITELVNVQALQTITREREALDVHVDLERVADVRLRDLDGTWE